MAGAGRQSARLADVEFAALNRWHITSWHLESSAAGQLSQASALPCSRRSFLGWRWAFSWKPSSRLSVPLWSVPLCSDFYYHQSVKSWDFCQIMQKGGAVFFSCSDKIASSPQNGGCGGPFAVTCFLKQSCPLYDLFSAQHTLILKGQNRLIVSDSENDPNDHFQNIIYYC